MTHDIARPTVFLLHALGASGGAWRPVVARLGGAATCIAPDLPGFGDHRAADTSIPATLDWLTGEIGRRAPAAWMLVGHSMGGKFATLLAARAAAGDARLAGLRGVVLCAASPPAPEPMAESRRAEMVGWFADGPADEAEARRFVEANVASSLPPALAAQAIADVRRSSPTAWTGWLTCGACEDWRDRVGRLAVPATIVAGAEDADLGEAGQRSLNVPHYPGASVVVVPGAAHLVPYERPAVLAGLIAETLRHS